MKKGDNTDVAVEDDGYYIEGGRLLARTLPGQEVVISGIAGVFPCSRDLVEFRENLFNKVNMVLPNRRWDYIHPEIPECSGTIPEINKYDGGFFGVHERQSQSMDALNRIFQEKVVEAIFDAGLHPSELEGTRTGVYVGVCASENDKSWFFDNLGAQTFAVTGCERSMVAHRISYFFKLKGPSTIIDTACSSSLHGLENAYKAIRLGEIDNAIVGGTNLCLHPFTTMQFLRLGVLSKDGSCKAFDAQGNGYARSEGFGVVILQRAKNAKRIYAQILHTKTNSDGYKEQGITFPSKVAQTKLLRDFYEECDVDRFSLSFLEAHGTGTKVGDPEECASIDQVLTSGRKRPLLMGSVKSNIGHSEPASGLCSIFKCILAMETGYIPPNIHFKTPKKEITGLIEGRLKVVVDKMPLEDDNGLMGVNNFGFGGSNGHVLLRWNPRKKIQSENNLPKLVCVSGRTEEAVTVLLNQISCNAMDHEYIKLVHEVFGKNIINHPYRGYILVSKSEEISRSLEFCPEYGKPLYLAFGELENWYDIGKQLMGLPAFFESFQRLQKCLINKGIDILDIINKTSNSFLVLGSVAVQIAIVDVLKVMDVKAVGSLGYSLGELVSAYYNEVLTLEETVNCSLVINAMVPNFNEMNNNIKLKEDPGISENCELPEDKSDMLNENEKILNPFKESLKFNKSIRNTLLSNLKNELILSGKNNVENKINVASNLVNALTTNRSINMEEININSVVLTIGDCPLEEIECVPMVPVFENKSKNYFENFLQAFGRLYNQGYNPSISKLYPQVKFPVARGTPMISPYIRWKHNTEKFTPQYSLDVVRQTKRRIRHYRIEKIDHQWAFVVGHVIDGRNLFPATGYLYLVWETFMVINGIPLNVSRVTMENCKFMRATSVPARGVVMFSVSIQSGSGDFEVVEGNTTIVSGRIKLLPESEVQMCDFGTTHLMNACGIEMSKKDVYKELRLRGYNYSGDFKAIEKYRTICSNISIGHIKWDENWVAFMDNMLQMKILQLDSRSMYVPVFISKINIIADSHCELIKETFKGSTSPNLPVYASRCTGEIKCGGITISGLIANPITRKKNLATPVIETYEFIPNHAKLELNASVRVNTQIILENTLTYKVKAVELIDDFTDENAEPLTPSIKTALEDEPLVQPILKILSQNTVHIDIERENKELGAETDCILVIATRVLERPEILKQAFAALKEDGYIMSRESYDFNIEKCICPNTVIVTVHKTEKETIVLLQKSLRKEISSYIKIDSSRNFSWVPEVQVALSKSFKKDLVLFSENESSNGILGLVNCLRREPSGRKVRCILILDNSLQFNPDSPIYRDQLKKNMCVNVYKNGQWGTYRHLLLNQCNKVENEHGFVALTMVGDLSSLKWTNGYLTRESRKLGMELVHVYYASLNFKDIMIATGKINNDVFVSNRLEQEFIPGFEFSGRDIRGTRVMGVTMTGALTNILYADPLLVYPVPDEWSLDEAATIPVVYLTVLCALIIRGNMKRGESILIHSGTGGIGQAAIYLALHYGCQVFTTVGTQEKREFLKRKYPQLKDENIGNSHDESFEQLVYRGTNGRGVDLVLNSLAEEKLIASVRCLAQRGIFLEIGKFDLSSNNYLNLLLFRKQADFEGVTLDKIFIESPEIKLQMRQIFKKLMKEGAIKPLDRTVFKCDEIEQAFRFMASGKHKGKVMIKIRDPEDELVVQSSIQKIQGAPRYYCDDKGVYIIVGGLGGFGLELADWLILRGARKLVLTSRKGITNGYQDLRIRLWRSYGVTVKVSRTPLHTKEGCKLLIEESLHLGHITAIFNLAVVLADAIFENQTAESFTTSFIPKAFATEYLDDLSRKMCPDLRDFVVFSSVSCGRGNAGQTNYGMANSVMERVCENRKLDGYPALAVEWGAVGEVGLVAEMQENHTELEISGTLPQRISSCLQVLDTLLTQKEAAIVSSMVVAEKKGAQSADNIVDAIINLIGIPDLKSISVHSTLAELGMDSMTAVEIRQVLERDFEVFLSARDLRTMTLARLKIIQESRNGASEDTEGKQSSEFGIQMMFRLIDSEENSKIASIPITPNNDPMKPPKIILFPGIEGFASVFKCFAKGIKDATAVQYILDGQTISIANIVKSVIPIVMELLQKDTHLFTIVAYSYGSIIALEVVDILESLGYKGTLTCIDGSPVLMKRVLQGFTTESEHLFQVNLMYQLLSFCIPHEQIAENKVNILKCETWQEKVDLAAQLLKSSAVIDAHYFTMFANTLYGRLKDLETYTPSYRNLKSKIILFKPESVIVQDIAEDYGLSEFFENPIEIQHFEGNHQTILENGKLCLAINMMMEK